MSSPLSGRVVLVTGAARGIGAATARSLAARGARVSIAGLEPERMADVAASIGGIWTEADVTDTRQVRRAVAATVERFGRLDAVVANAGVANYGTVLAAKPEDFARTIDVNLIGVYRTLHAAIEHLKERRGYALIVSSIASRVALPGAAAYTASKAAIDAMAAVLRIELGSTGVMVGTVHPGWVQTDMILEAEQIMPTFGDLRAALPWPANVTITPERAGEAIAHAVERRSRRVYVPREVQLLGMLSPLMQTRLGDAAVRWIVGRYLRDMDREVRS